MIIIAEEKAFIAQRLNLHQTQTGKEIDKAVQRLANKLLKNAESRITYVSSVLKRKDAAIGQLQATLRKVVNDKHVLVNKLKAVKFGEMNKIKFEMDKSAGKNVDTLEIKKLREENKQLKAKNKAKARKIRQYKLLLEEVLGDGYDDDPDEEDGTPSEESEGAEDVGMIDAEKLLNEESSDDSDPDDSDYVLDEEDMSPEPKKRNEAAKAVKVAKEMKEEEEEEEEEQEVIGWEIELNPLLDEDMVISDGGDYSVINSTE